MASTLHYKEIVKTKKKVTEKNTRISQLLLYFMILNKFFLHASSIYFAIIRFRN